MGLYHCNKGLADPKQVSHFSISHTAAHCSNLVNVCASQLCAWICFAVAVVLNIASLAYHVGVIVGRRARKKMRWPHAKRVIAPVANVNSFGNRSKVQYPRCSMCVGVPVSCCAPSDFAIPLYGVGRPDPTRSQFGTVCRYRTILIHFRPKALWEGFRKTLRGQILGGNLDRLRLLPRWVYWTREAFKFLPKNFNWRKLVNNGGYWLGWRLAWWRAAA